MSKSISEAVGLLHETAALLGEETAPEFCRPATKSGLDSLARSSKRALSADPRAFLSLHRAIVAMDVFNGYWLGASKSGRLVLPSTPTAAKLTSDAEPVIPVATDGGGNAFVQSVQSGSIWRWITRRRSPTWWARRSQTSSSPSPKIGSMPRKTTPIGLI